MAFENGLNAIYGNAVASLDLRGLELNHEHAADLSKALKSNSTLEELKLWGNEIGAAGAQSLANMLQFNRALTSLGLSSNSIVVSRGGGWTHDPNAYWKYVHTDGRKTDDRPDGVDFEADLSGIQALAGALKVNRALTSVNLLRNDLGGGAAAVVAAAKQHGKIKTLCGIEEGKTEVDFRFQHLKAPDAALLSFDLEVNRALTSLNLRSNGIGDGGAQAIAAALPQS